MSKCASGRGVLKWLLLWSIACSQRMGSGFHCCTLSDTCALGEGMGLAPPCLLLNDPLKNPETWCVLRAKWISSGPNRNRFQVCAWHLVTENSIWCSVLILVSCIHFLLPNLVVWICFWVFWEPVSLLLRIAAEPFLSLSGVQFVSPMWLLNVFFFELVTSRCMLHSNFKRQNFSL